jgi:hypothetical protein
MVTSVNGNSGIEGEDFGEDVKIGFVEGLTDGSWVDGSEVVSWGWSVELGMGCGVAVAGAMVGVSEGVGLGIGVGRGGVVWSGAMFEPSFMFIGVPSELVALNMYGYLCKVAASLFIVLP